MASEDLKMMFDYCVNRVLVLIDEQVSAVAKNGGRVKVSNYTPVRSLYILMVRCFKYIFLAGGLGSSEYLRVRVSQYCKNHGFGLRIPEAA
jgi:hypothetical protein